MIFVISAMRSTRSYIKNISWRQKVFFDSWGVPQAQKFVNSNFNILIQDKITIYVLLYEFKCKMTRAFIGISLEGSTLSQNIEIRVYNFLCLGYPQESKKTFCLQLIFFIYDLVDLIALITNIIFLLTFDRVIRDFFRLDPIRLVIRQKLIFDVQNGVDDRFFLHKYLFLQVSAIFTVNDRYIFSAVIVNTGFSNLFRCFLSHRFGLQVFVRYLDHFFYFKKCAYKKEQTKLYIQ